MLFRLKRRKYTSTGSQNTRIYGKTLYINFADDAEKRDLLFGLIVASLIDKIETIHSSAQGRNKGNCIEYSINKERGLMSISEVSLRKLDRRLGDYFGITLTQLEDELIFC